MTAQHHELDKIDEQITRLYSFREQNKPKWKRATLIHFLGVALLFGGGMHVFLSPFDDEYGTTSWTFDYFVLLIGGLLLWYGFTELRSERTSRLELDIYELARLLKRAEVDNRLKLETNIEFGGLHLKFFDPHHSEEGFYEKTLRVSYWGRLYLDR